MRGVWGAVGCMGNKNTTRAILLNWKECELIPLVFEGYLTIEPLEERFGAGNGG